MATRKGSSSNVITAAFPGSQPMDDEAAAWVLRERKISRATLERLNVECGTVYFREKQKNLRAIIFRYDDGGFKARAMDDKAFTSSTGLHVDFWGLSDVLAGPLDTVWIVEGEFDRCALVEAGISPDRVLASPGSQMQPNPETGELEFVGKLQYAKDALRAGLSKVKKFILCTDQDEAGLGLRGALAKLLGYARTHFIDWPEGVKDANEFLQKGGDRGLEDRLEELTSLLMHGSLPWPAEGVYQMSQIAEPPWITRWHPGFDEWGNKLFLAPGMLSVVTGHPGHGKTQLWAQIWFQIIQRYDLVACIATFETKPKPHYQKVLRQLHARRPLYDSDGGRIMSDEELRAADQWIEAHYRFIIHREERPTLAWLLGQAEIVVHRDNAKVLQVDPWNRLEAEKEKGENDTDYIGRCLRALYAFANDLQVHVQILAHPSKMEGFRRGGMPALEDIAGSKHWENMVDQGFVVYRPKLFDDCGQRDTYAELHHLKARFDALGYPAKFGMNYDPDQGRYGTRDLMKKERKPKKKKDDDDD